ncbi:ABC transporter substrate-binding protein [Caloramator sp. ALD01]|uniref:ABC transporter substrate-binding protein n=1 Tax=Caloramator sp. ALD01 TaxID=1031288 RepID=UPI0003FAF88E|nr:ABC transporter substrate-binding protein [Caloramator sp. ALD01]
MVGKNKKSILISCLLITSILCGCATSKGVNSTDSIKSKKVFQIGVTQIVEHPALDDARKGFIEALKSKGYEDGKNIKIDYQNAQGDIATTQSIAKNFVAQNKDLILAIATPSAQSALNATKDIPIIITAVTDPVKSGLAKSMQNSGNNVTGTSDAVPISNQFELLKKLIPNAKKVGILYNTSESNSELQINEAKNIAPNFNLEIVPVGITSVNEATTALNTLLEKVDVLYTPTDNLVASSMPIIVEKCMSKNIPVIGSEKSHVSAGAIATVGIDYFKLGFQTGLIAVEVIEGKKPSDIPLSTLNEMQLVLNTDSIKKLNIKVPDDILSKAEKIGGSK